jgi:predicted DNA binding CopG/RHH family protein
MKKQKKTSDQSIATYWETHDATEVLDLAKKNQIELIYEPPVQSISLRLPVPLLNKIKRIASNMDIAYQALIKVWLAEMAKNTK